MGPCCHSFLERIFAALDPERTGPGGARRLANRIDRFGADGNTLPEPMGGPQKD